jgi:hypothetical protein
MKSKQTYRPETRVLIQLQLLQDISKRTETVLEFTESELEDLLTKLKMMKQVWFVGRWI